ncbi:hypothetical protein WJ60_04605 [Burkholderia ubonensis]|uniref:hypothetical protein n=1 Tax=Burkholderia ubonensis TaxID=101571 RepID=UPI0007549220|nr:hypothetical protein [Burkholderia ubonensis]KVM79246.1 hypothetical protein WJ60_04605 [Burkholderia ubonensis]KVX80513.1 hypothetical protein WL08_12550 [Burkholderia ubonensis]
MKPSDAVQLVKAAVSNAATAGAVSIPVANLNSYLDGLIKSLKESEAGGQQKSDEQIKHELEVWKTQTSTDLAFGVELLKGTIEAGQTALRSAIAINGGAAVAMLAFVGNAVTKWQTGGPLLSKVGAAMLVFVLSAGFGATATGFRYLAQFWYSESRYAGAKKERMLRCGGVANVVSILLGVASFAGFFAGGVLAYRAIATY